MYVCTYIDFQILAYISGATALHIGVAIPALKNHFCVNFKLIGTTVIPPRPLVLCHTEFFCVNWNILAFTWFSFYG